MHETRNKKRRKGRVKARVEEEEDPAEGQTRTRFTERRGQLQGSHVADEVIRRIGDICQVEDGSRKLVSSFKFSMYVIGAPIYLGFYYYPVLSPNFFIAWLLHRFSPIAVWRKINSRVAENFRARHPGLERCTFTFKLPDSFRQDPKSQHEYLRERAKRKQVEDNSKMEGIFSMRKGMLASHIKYGFAYEMAENQKAMVAIPLFFGAANLIDVQGWLLAWGFWDDSIMKYLVPLAGASYICRFLAPITFARAVKRAENRLYDKN